MIQPQVSVVVVSRHRPDALKRCILGLSQLRYPAFEIVVVADPDALAQVRTIPVARHLKCVDFDLPNISEARNLGISHAAGAVVAFIDDDAVPEPSWLTHLAAAFDRDGVAAAGGFVRGRNGISWQWQGRTVGAMGDTAPLDVNPARITVMTPGDNRAIKTEGTNMAVRRDVLVALDGFDPGFAFYLDETDLNLRLLRAGHATALVPMAEVHHGYAASARRRADRVPRDLFDIGSSWAVFQRKHLAPGDRAAHWRALRNSERRRALTHMVAGRLQPRDVRQLLERLDHGYMQGLERKRGDAQLSRAPLADFRPFPAASGDSVVLGGRVWHARTLRDKAASLVRDGHVVSLFLFSPTALYHKVRFADDGYWEQSGGMFGRADRSSPLFVPQTFAGRLEAEVRRVAGQRLIDT